MKHMERPNAIVVHHSLTKDTSSYSWDAIRKYHKETMGWDDIGYHYGVEEVEGVVRFCVGRPDRYQGAHTKENNKSIGVCVVGNFDEERLGKEKQEVVVGVLTWLLRRFKHLTYSDIYPHNFYAPYKSCPGNLFPFDEVIAAVKEKIDNDRKAF